MSLLKLVKTALIEAAVFFVYLAALAGAAGLAVLALRWFLSQVGPC